MPITGTIPADTTPVILGGNGNDASGVPTELFPGRIDELMLYARALSAAEIAKLAAGALFPAGARDAGRGLGRCRRGGRSPCGRRPCCCGGGCRRACRRP